MALSTLGLLLVLSRQQDVPQLILPPNAPPPPPWAAYASFCVVAPLDEPAPKPDAVAEVARWAATPGTRSVLNDRYRLVVDGAKNGLLVSTRIPEVRKLTLLPVALRAMPRVPPGLGATFGDYGPAVADVAAETIFPMMPLLATGDGKVPPTTRFKYVPKRTVTVQSGGRSFDLALGDGSDINMDPEERKRFNEWFQAGRLPLQGSGKDRVRTIQADMDRYAKTNARDGVRTMVLQKPYEQPVSGTVMDATKAYIEFLKALHKEAERDWAPLRDDVQKRYPYLEGYREGAGWNDLSPREQDNLRLGLQAYEARGQIPGGLDAFLSGLSISSSRLTFGLGVPFEGTRGFYYVPLTP